MRIVATTLDDLCRKVLPRLLDGADTTQSSRGLAHERRGVLLELKNPRARLSRTETRGKPFSCLGELLWYLSRDNRLEFIEYYIERYKKESEDGETVHGGYGRRLFAHESHDQVQTLIANLRQKPDTRRAVLQIFEPRDTERRYKEIPCTLAMQFRVIQFTASYCTANKCLQVSRAKETDDDDRHVVRGAVRHPRSPYEEGASVLAPVDRHDCSGGDAVGG